MMKRQPFWENLSRPSSFSCEKILVRHYCLGNKGKEPGTSGKLHFHVHRNTEHSLLLTRAVNSWKITQTCLYASLHKTHDSPSEWKGRWDPWPRRSWWLSVFFFSFSFHCLAMREENQIMHLENEKRKRWGLWEFRASGALRKPLFICQELSWMCSTCGIYLLTFPPDLYQGKVSWGDDDYNHWSQAKVNYLLTLLKCCACLSLGSP